MNTIKKELYHMIDNLPEQELFTAKKFLGYLLSAYSKITEDEFTSIFENAPEDDEPLTEDEILAVEESKIAIKRGEVISHEAVRREIFGK